MKLDAGIVYLLIIAFIVGMVVGFALYNNFPRAIPSYCLRFLK